MSARPAVKLSDLPASVRAKVAPKKTRVTQKKLLTKLRQVSEAARRETFSNMLRSARLPMPTPEHRFDAKRMWRFDYAWPDAKVALEVEGGAWTNGRHTRGKGFIADLEKYSEAAVQGWCVIRCVPAALTYVSTENLIRRALKSRSQ